jgi:uncharacterized protein (DUF849 family)
LIAGVPHRSVLLHGEHATMGTFVAEAFARSHSTRVGLEDGKSMPDGPVAGSNAERVAAAEALRRKVAN